VIFIRNVSAMSKRQPFHRLLAGLGARESAELWRRRPSGARRPQPRPALEVD